MSLENGADSRFKLGTICDEGEGGRWIAPSLNVMPIPSHKLAETLQLPLRVSGICMYAYLQTLMEIDFLRDMGWKVRGGSLLQRPLVCSAYLIPVKAIVCAETATGDYGQQLRPHVLLSSAPVV